MTKLLRPRRKFLETCLLSGLAACVPVSAATASYVVGVVPRKSAGDTLRAWKPFLDQVAREAGVSLTLKLYDQAADFESDLVSGKPDFIYCNAYHLTLAHRTQAYRPLVRAGTSDFRGLLVVRTDSGITGLPGLMDAQIAFPSPSAFVASLYMRAVLSLQEKLRFRPVYAGTHRNVIQSVLNGGTVAGGVASDLFDEEPEAMRSMLRTVFKTPPLPAHALGVHPRVPPSIGTEVARAIIAMKNDPEGNRLADLVGLPVPVEASYETDYRSIDAMNFDKFK